MIHTIHFYETPEPDSGVEVIPVDHELLDNLLEDISHTLDSILESSAWDNSYPEYRSMPEEFIRFQGRAEKESFDQ